jgi:hypothetical protein
MPPLTTAQERFPELSSDYETSSRHGLAWRFFNAMDDVSRKALEPVNK